MLTGLIKEKKSTLKQKPAPGVLNQMLKLTLFTTLTLLSGCRLGSWLQDGDH